MKIIQIGINVRNDFYKMQDTSKLSKTFIENFYRKLFSLIGFETVNYHTICRVP